MSGRDRDKFRKYISGSEKRRKKQQREELQKKERGTFDKYVIRSNEVIEVANAVISTLDETDNHINIENNLIENELNFESDNIDTDIIFNVDKNTSEKSMYNTHTDLEKQITKDVSSILDFNEPTTWPEYINNDLRADFVKHGTIKITNYNFPYNDDKPYPRSFTKQYYIHSMVNGEVVDRQWLVYSKIKDRVFCFCCVLFSQGNSESNLANIKEGVNDWKHLSQKLLQHERSKPHYLSLKQWYDLKIGLKSLATIDQQHLAQIEKEKNHWRAMLQRILCIIQYLSKHNDGFRGKSDVLFTKNNGKFLGLVEMLSKFDSVTMEHVRRIKNVETHTHYLGHDIQDELINFMANEVKKKIINEIQQCKYYSIIMDCTPDTSRQEQLSIMIRTVNMYENDEFCVPKIKEYFLDFIIVESTTGLSLANVILGKLNEYGIQISNCRG